MAGGSRLQDAADRPNQDPGKVAISGGGINGAKTVGRMPMAALVPPMQEDTGLNETSERTEARSVRLPGEIFPAG